MHCKRLFKTKEIAKLLEVPQRQLNYWIAKDIFEPSIYKCGGKGNTHIYDCNDLIILLAVREMVRYGIPPMKIKKSIDFIRDHLEECLPPTTVIVTDGNEVFKIIKTEEEAFEIVRAAMHKTSAIYTMPFGKMVRDSEKVSEAVNYGKEQITMSYE